MNHPYLGVSKNRGTPKWMVYNGKPYQNWWFGGTPIFGNTHSSASQHKKVYECIGIMRSSQILLKVELGYRKSTKNSTLSNGKIYCQTVTFPSEKLGELNGFPKLTFAVVLWHPTFNLEKNHIVIQLGSYRTSSSDTWFWQNNPLKVSLGMVIPSGWSVWSVWYSKAQISEAKNDLHCATNK